MNVANYISCDPKICGGKPCFKGTRIPIYLTLELLEAGLPIDKIISPDYYPQLSKEAVQAALHYAADLVQTGEYVPFTTTA